MLLVTNELCSSVVVYTSAVQISAAKFRSLGEFLNQDLNIFSISHRNFQCLQGSLNCLRKKKIIVYTLKISCKASAISQAINYKKVVSISLSWKRNFKETIYMGPWFLEKSKKKQGLRFSRAHAKDVLIVSRTINRSYEIKRLTK